MTSPDAPDLPLAQPLTPREEEILDCLGQEMSNRQIAEHLTISLNTVKWYVRQVYNKLGVSSRAAAVARARSLGLLAEERESAPKHYLPLAPTPFIGREVELAALAGLIADPQVRLITITGPGGIGKTRLALEAARNELQPPSLFQDGVFFVSLAAIESAGELVSTLAAALNFHFQDSGGEREQILSYLSQKQMLLVMDNFEHILDGRELLAEIGRRAAAVKILVTSREHLQLLGEQLFPLQGLALPQDEANAAEAPAVQLFLNISRRALPDFQLLEGDAGPLVRICRLVEGMPLGLELAASWAGLLPLSEIADEIAHGLQVLSSAHHDVPPRHQSMQAALDVSWARLNDQQKRALQELTVFGGGFARAAALEVAGASLPILVTLANKSWLTYDRQKDRYTIHELLRQYGAAKLAADPVHEQQVRERHCAYFCAYLEERRMDWFGPRQTEAFTEVRDEIDNIQRAWRRAAAEGSCILLGQGLHSLCRFYSFEGRRSDGLRASRAAREGLETTLAKGQFDEAPCLALLSQILAWESDFVEEVAERENMLAQSRQILERAAQIAWDTRAEEAFIHLETAYALGNQDRDAAIRASKQAQVLFREMGDRWSLSEASRMAGANYLFLGDFQEAEKQLRESLAIRKELQDWRGIAQTTTDLGLAAQHQGHYKEAEALHRQALGIHRQLQSVNNEAYTLMVLSFTQSWAGDFVSAGESARRAFDLYQEISDVPNLWNLIALALADFHLGGFAKARSTAAAALQIAGQRGHTLEKALALLFAGDVAFINGDLDTAVDYLAESGSLMAEAGYVYQALPRTDLCFVLRAQGDGEQARAFLASALCSGLAYHSTTPIMVCLPVAALLAADDGHLERATELHAAAQQFGHISSSRWFAKVANSELESVRKSLPPDVARAAVARGREMDVWQTAEALRDELNGR